MKKYALYFVIPLALIALLLQLNSLNSLVKPVGVLLFGVSMGYILQRSRFCLASAFMDLVLFKDAKLFRSVIILIAVSTLGFALLQTKGAEGYIVAIGWRTLVGGLLFGLGMTLAGSCAAGTLMRIGEGYVLFAVVLLGLIIGGALGAYHYHYWGTPSAYMFTVFLPKTFGWLGSVIIQLSLLLVLWLSLKKWG